MTIRPLFPAVLAGLFAACAQAAALAPAAITAEWRQQQSPRVAALAEHGRDLQQKLDALCQRKNAANLDAARDAWRQTWLAWRAVEAMPLGPVMSRRTAWQIDVWPTKAPKVEEAVRLVKHDAAIADSVGAASQGLPALEYLLWGDDRPAAQLGRLVFRQRCEYATALGNDIAAETRGLYTDWQNYAATPIEGEQGAQAFEDAFNMLAASIDALRDKKIARIGNPKVKTPVRQDVDGWRSRSTRQGMLATFDAIEGLLFKSTGGVAFATNLAEVRPLTMQHLTREFATARALITRLPDDASSWMLTHRAHTQALAESLKRIQNLVEIEVADAVGVTIGFKDSDGD